jgi:hypothetical protein
MNGRMIPEEQEAATRADAEAEQIIENARRASLTPEQREKEDKERKVYNFGCVIILVAIIYCLYLWVWPRL